MLNRTAKQILHKDITSMKLGEIVAYKEIAIGLSQTCFSVTLALGGEIKHVIAKVYAEQLISNTTEFKAYQIINQSAYIAPRLLAFGTNTLLLEDLSLATKSTGSTDLKKELLLTSGLTLPEKVKTSLQAMALLHQQPLVNFPFCASLTFTDIFAQLLQSVNLPEAALQAINVSITHNLDACQQLLQRAEQQGTGINRVLCHGDLNFGNVFVGTNADITTGISTGITTGNSAGSTTKNIRLIDFESLCIMPAEYDVAMMLAVNELSLTSHQTLLTELFDKRAHTNGFNDTLCEHYYALALLINGLWYLSKAQQSFLAAAVSVQQLEERRAKSDFYSKAKTQFSLAGIEFDSRL